VFRSSSFLFIGTPGIFQCFFPGNLEVYGSGMNLRKRRGGGPQRRQNIREGEGGISAAGDQTDRETKEGPEMEKSAEKGDVDLNRVFTDNDRDLNRLFPDLSLKRFLQEIDENKREVRTFLKALEIEDEGDE
jgi:hypothetical protein